MCVSTSDWKRFVEQMIPMWEDFYNFWFDNSKNGHLDLFILFYEDLVNDLERSLSNLAYFLGAPLSKKDFQCIQKNVEGKHHRGTIGKDPFENVDKFTSALQRIQNDLNQQIDVCLQENRCVTSGSSKQPPQTLNSAHQNYTKRKF